MKHQPARNPESLTTTKSARSARYSRWIFTAVRNLVATDEFATAASLAQRFHVPLSSIQKVLRFIIDHNLVQQQEGKLSVGPTYTHVSADSPLEYIEQALKIMRTSTSVTVRCLNVDFFEF